MSSFGRLSASLLAIAISLGAAQAAPGLTVVLTGNQNVNNVDNFNVVATLKNTGTETLSLYNEPRGLLSTLPTDSFRVSKTTDGSGATFHGLVAKYAFGGATSFTTLAPEESVDVTHNLAKAYQFDSTGSYTIIPNTQFFYKDADGNPVPIEAELVRGGFTAKLSGSLQSRHVEKRRARAAESRKRAIELGKRATYANCSPAQEEIILESTWVASLYAADSEKYLTLNTANTDRWVTWFGEYEPSNHERVLGHFTNLRSSDVKTYTYDCECTEGSDDTFAYVYPTEFGHIYLCNQYMVAEVAGTDSRAGTIIHEASHFIRNGGTEDYAYGHTRAQALAITNSTLATMNADSHEYFAENTPPLA